MPHPPGCGVQTPDATLGLADVLGALMQARAVVALFVAFTLWLCMLSAAKAVKLIVALLATATTKDNNLLFFIMIFTPMIR